MAKNIVVFSDGTGQEGGKGFNSNVYKLFNMVEDRSAQQVAFYDRGLGTGWRKLLGQTTGLGISRNIKDCYRFIFDEFESGDSIYLFGFSRGATTVRSLSGFLHMFGILPKSRPELIDEAYRIYRIGDSARRLATAQAFVERHHTMWCRVRFLGVWDTVAALGVPIRAIDVALDKLPMFRHRFHDLKLSPCVENAAHALSIDDERKIFHPTLWDPEIHVDYQKMEQVWFCGVHSDIGGGYAEHQLSDIALEWMLNHAESEGLRIFPKNRLPLAPDVNGRMHDSREGIGKLYRRAPRQWDVKIRGPARLHPSVLERRKNTHNEDSPRYQPWILQQTHTLAEPPHPNTL